jgi:hypothetical protein
MTEGMACVERRFVDRYLNSSLILRGQVHSGKDLTEGTCEIEGGGDVGDCINMP